MQVKMTYPIPAMLNAREDKQVREDATTKYTTFRVTQKLLQISKIMKETLEMPKKNEEKKADNKNWQLPGLYCTAWFQNADKAHLTGTQNKVLYTSYQQPGRREDTCLEKKMSTR